MQSDRRSEIPRSADLRLRPFEPADVSTLVGWIPSKEFLIQWAGHLYTFPLDEAQVRAHLSRVGGPPPVCRIFAVEGPAGSMIGYIELNRIDRVNRNAALSRILVGPSAARGKGLGAEMIRRTLAIGFEEERLHRIELDVYQQNVSARRCYQRCGFRDEGLIRDFTFVDGSYWSSYRMSILDDEWRAHVRSGQGKDHVDERA
jgi:RimJ/RimL family protein N-acetyltransferase